MHINTIQNDFQAVIAVDWWCRQRIRHYMIHSHQTYIHFISVFSIQRRDLLN